VFTRALHCSLLRARRIKPISPQPISLRSILILSFHLILSLPSGRFTSYFPTKILDAFSFSHIRAKFPVHLVLLDLVESPNNMYWRVRITKLLTVENTIADFPKSESYNRHPTEQYNYHVIWPHLHLIAIPIQQQHNLLLTQ
jgi:hypothetical protein